MEPTDIDVGMYGAWVISFNISNSDGKVLSSGDGRGGKRKLTMSDRTYIGAIAVLNEDTRSEKLSMSFYHNGYAKNRLWPKYFPHKEDSHFVKDGDPNNLPGPWSEYIGPRI